MLHREVNPLEERHVALSARFKAAWALHQLLIGMQRLNSGGNFENLAERFQTLYARLKSFSESLRALTTGHDTLNSELAGIEREVENLCSDLIDQEEEISPADLRKFITQVRTLDDRILIEVARFYLELHRDRDWHQDHLDKIDFLLSHLAERIAGPELRGDRVRLEKVLQGLEASAGPVDLSDKEIADFTETLEGLRSEVQWVKSFDELNETSLLEIYRALKEDMAGRMFHPRVLPIVVEVNNAYRRKIEDLSKREEKRILDDYQTLTQLQQDSPPQAEELEEDFVVLQQQFEGFRERAKTDNVRIGELMALGQSLKDIADRLQSHGQSATVRPESEPVPPTVSWVGLEGNARMALNPDLDSLQPHWSELLQALSGLGGEFSAQQVESDSSLATFRLEDREVMAFQRTIGSEPANVGLEQFILAGAAIRRRLCEEVSELRNLHSQTPGGIPKPAWMKAREGARIGDAYVKHYSHMAEQAIFDGQSGEAREYQILQYRMNRELSGLVILLSRLSSQIAGSNDESAASADPTGGSSGKES